MTLNNGLSQNHSIGIKVIKITGVDLLVSFDVSATNNIDDVKLTWENDVVTDLASFNGINFSNLSGNISSGGANDKDQSDFTILNLDNSSINSGAITEQILELIIDQSLTQPNILDNSGTTIVSLGKLASDFFNNATSGYKIDASKFIQTWLIKHRFRLVNFLKYSYACSHNNPAERAIRPMVILRKISGGSKSQRGIKATDINMSIIKTWAKQNLSLIQKLPVFGLSL